MTCNYNPATGEVETLLERYQREAEINERIEERVRMEQAMKAVAFVSQIKYPHPATYQLRQQRRK